MESQLTPQARRQLVRFCRQCLQLHADLDYPDGESLRNDAVQQAIYKTLFQEHAVGHPPPPRYQIRVLKELTRRIENSIQDWEEEGISDDLMNCLSSLLSSSIPSETTAAQQKSYVTYTLSHFPCKGEPTPTITLLEARRMLAASGTTGLRTWEAALHLGNYLCENASIIQGKSILELGSGTGYLAILCAKHLGASHVLATDGAHDVVTSLPTNFYLNGLQDTTFIESKDLLWGQALLGGEHPEWHRGRGVDLVIGTDLTYDGRNISPLVATFGDLFELYPDVKIIIGATVRNPTTFEQFLDTCRNNGYAVSEIQFGMKRLHMQEGPFCLDNAPIKLCLVSRVSQDVSCLNPEYEYTNEKV